MMGEKMAPSSSRIVGLDIGGANLKAARVDGTARHQMFALWKTPELLEKQLREMVDSLPACESLAVTMTGELCDCFATKREGVVHIVRSTLNAADGKPVR